ncbi:unnamed protein product [Ectocarpus sp. CCAP 1310/34]|nr:unnamed protein product [Ectocarpus sp. CCAP 1310/34]
MATSELSELRAELWRTRDDLERIKSRGTPPSADCSPRRHFDRRRHRASPSPTLTAATAHEEGDKDRDHRRHRHSEQHKGDGLEGGGGIRGDSGGGIGSGPTSTPTSGGSSPGSGADIDDEAPRGLGGTAASGSSPGGRQLKFGSSRGGVGSASSEGENAAKGGSSEEAAAEETLCNLELEGAAFKNWTEEASSIAVRLIEEVKMLRWEKASWTERERAAERASERAAAEARAQAAHLEERLGLAEADGRRAQEALARAQQDVERERARAKTERAKAEGLRTAAATAAAAASAAQQEKEKMQYDQQRKEEARQQQERDVAAGGGGGLVEMLRREKEGADALQRRLDAARAASAKHEKERKEWRSSKARLEELRRSWGKQLNKVEKKMRSMAKENAALRARVGEAERARDRADADSLGHREELRRLTEQRDNLLLGATRLGGRRGLAASSPAETLAELLAAAAAGAAADATDVGPGAEGELEAQLERARSEAKLARVAAQQERLRREAAAREKEEAVRQLHRLMGAARRAVGRRDSRLKSSRMETEVVWNALTEAVR